MAVVPFPGNHSPEVHASNGRSSSSRSAGRKTDKAQEVTVWRPAPKSIAGAAELIAQIQSPPPLFDIDFDAIYQLTEGAANEDLNNPVVATGQAEIALRQLIARFGFERMPFTCAELNGLLDYCIEFEGVTGEDLPEEYRELWRASSLKSCEDISPKLLPAVKLYLAGDMDGLRRFHRDERTLERLGREYRLPEDD